MPSQFQPHRLPQENDPIDFYVAEFKQRLVQARTDEYHGAMTFEVFFHNGGIPNMNVITKESVKNG